ncbi:MAG TPA: symmetrical bis(5'-nucleosyl)-tetraphosphatase [Burkholderiales bacterium]|nr:symmetrical bis(5'-nucleosyl)-tetraphosphatase [Burkholderiales bacterium]
MATYAIGDVQGCYDELRALLAQVGFDSARDRLWFVGDLVNRGPKSLEVLRFVRSLGDRTAVTVLGNHDLHLLCLAEGFAKRREDDTLEAVLAAVDAADLLGWLRGRPLMHREGGHAMVHAGLLPQWDIEQALTLAGEVEVALRAPNYREFLAELYGSKPARWSDALEGWDRLRVIVNAMTRMRFCSPEGEMDFHVKCDKAPAGFLPWFEARPPRDEVNIVCGHWSALGLKLSARVSVLDAGCVWGGSLAALRLEDGALAQLPCRRYHAVIEE